MIYIVTVHRSLNFGSILQAHALYTVLQRYDDVRMLNVGTRNIHRQGIKAALRQLRKRNVCGAVFYVKKLRACTKMISQLREVTKVVSHEKDVFVFGSDEIWNVKRKIMADYPIFWGQGIHKGYRISYAPSINNATREDLLLMEYIPEALSSFSAISVRDEHSRSVIASLTEKPVQVVLDPTFLMDREYYEKKSKVRIRRDYIAVYVYGQSNTAQHACIYRELARQLGKRMISVGSYQPWCDENIVGVNAFDFFLNADYVITDTFHGTAFSINFGKQFIVVMEQNMKISMLLSTFGLEDRVVPLNQKAEECIECLKRPIDYKHVNAILQEEQKRSFKYLEDAMSQVGKMRSKECAVNRL